jgi:serine/threonine protein kinase
MCTGFASPLGKGFLITINKQRWYAARDGKTGPIELTWSEVDEIEKYQLIALQKIGQGQNQVLEGILKNQHGYFLDTVALKVLHQNEGDYSLSAMTKSPAETRKIELAVLANISHPNAVHYYGFYLDDNGSLVLVMERLAGSLDQFIDKLNCEQKIRVLLDIAEGMHHLHSEHKFAHRDLKPQNVFMSILEEKGEIQEITAKVGDFGLCRKIESEIAEPYPDDDNHIAPGTGGYRAPEADEVFTAMSDVYSYGLITFLVLAGSSSWDRKWRKDLSSTPELTPELKSDLMAQFRDDWKVLEEILHKCLEHNWEERPSFAHVAEKLSPLVPKHSSLFIESKE